MINLIKVNAEDVYDTIHGFVTKREMIVDDYDAMIEVILAMIKEGYCFVFDRDILRDAMESLTYMYAPSDDMNRDRLVHQFADDEDDSEDDDEEDSEDDGGFGNMDLMKMMQMMGAPQRQSGESGEVDEEREEREEPEEPEELDECKNIVTDESLQSEPVETTVVKEVDTDM